jgi:2-succinyl-5-enolpyruvyl-6-hydroxy-3-cyclohexene-1-carboxylate synthase
VSGAAGSAIAAQRPLLLLVGDVSFAHDLSGLAAARRVATPFVIVVLDNDGGRIFDQLPAARLFRDHPETHALWTSPPKLDIEHVAQAFGLAYRRAAAEAELASALGAAFGHAGATIVHVPVAADSSKVAFAAITERIAGGLAP